MHMLFDLRKYIWSIVLVIAGILILLAPLWASLYSDHMQAALRAQEARNARRLLATVKPATGPALARGAARPQAMSPPFTIEIPKLGLSAVVVGGVSVADLREGPGLYPQGVRPGTAGNAAIAGHRTTYGAWFRHLDSLRKGNAIILTNGIETLTYRVQRVFVVSNTDWSPIAQTPGHILTLTTCTPLHTSKERLVVRASQVGWHTADVWSIRQ
jgi:sortase A